jgi:hypothetical protein
MIKFSIVNNLKSALVTEPSDFNQNDNFLEVESLDLDLGIQAPVTLDVPCALNLPRLKVLSVNYCNLSLRQILDDKSLSGVTMMAVANSIGSLSGMCGLYPSNLSRLNLLNLSLSYDELQWIGNLSGLISLKFSHCLGLPLRVLSTLSCGGVLRSLDVSGSWKVLCAQTLEMCFPTVRFLDLSEIRIPTDMLNDLTRSFPNIECFYASESGLPTVDIRRLISAWPNLKILRTGNRETDFHKHHSTQWSD